MFVVSARRRRRLPSFNRCIALPRTANNVVGLAHARHDMRRRRSNAVVGNAIPDRFANPGISGLSLLNPGIPGFPGLNQARLWLAIAGLVTGKIARTRTTRYRLNCTMHIVIGRLSCTFLHWHMVLFSVYCKSIVLFYA